MTIHTDAELEFTREQLAWFEHRYSELRAETGGDQHLREMTGRSLKRVINQLKEDMARYRARQPVGQ